MVLGEPVTARRIHSVRTLSLAVGVHPKRLRKLLATRGLISPQEGDLQDNRVVFAAEAGEAAAAALIETVPMNALPAYLGIGRVVAARIVAEGVVVAAVAPDARCSLNDRRFWRADLDTLVALCVHDAAAVDYAPPGSDDVRRVASRAEMTVAALLRAVMDRRDRVQLRSGHAKGALRVASEAARAALSPDPADADYAPYRAARRLRTTDRVVRALGADGPNGPILPSRPLPNNRSAGARVIPRGALDVFDRDYGSLTNLARERGAHHGSPAAALRARGVEPAFGAAVIGATFYRRADIPRDI